MAENSKSSDPYGVMRAPIQTTGHIAKSFTPTPVAVPPIPGRPGFPPKPYAAAPPPAAPYQYPYANYYAAAPHYGGGYPPAQPPAPAPPAPAYAYHPPPETPQTPTDGPTNVLWIGDLDWMDEQTLYSLFAPTGLVVSVKINRDKRTGQSLGFGFINFVDVDAAAYVLENYNGQLIPGTNRRFKLNWAVHGLSDKKRNEAQALYVGDLGPEVDEYYLLSSFQYYYPSVYSVKIVFDNFTGYSRGYGFVYFGDTGERMRALTEMQGFYLGSRPIRVNQALNKRARPDGPQPGANPSTPTITNNMPPPFPSQTVLLLEGFPDLSIVTPEALKRTVEPYGEALEIKLVPEKKGASVKFATHDIALKALNGLKDTSILEQPAGSIRVFWAAQTTSEVTAPKVENPSSAPKIEASVTVKSEESSKAEVPIKSEEVTTKAEEANKAQVPKEETQIQSKSEETSQNPEWNASVYGPTADSSFRDQNQVYYYETNESYRADIDPPAEEIKKSNGEVSNPTETPAPSSAEEKETVKESAPVTVNNSNESGSSALEPAQAAPAETESNADEDLMPPAKKQKVESSVDQSESQPVEKLD